MAAEINFRRRRKPTQPVPIALGHEEGSFRQVVLGGDCLHDIVGQPFFERAHCRRIAGERPVGEGIDLVQRNAHRSLCP
jgi:hypothetical protein